jgi:hypothetical protein
MLPLYESHQAQMMASEYKKRGGGYNTSKDDQSETQKHLDQWTKEDWQTKEGSGTAKKNDGTRKRYLPKQAWEQMSDDEKEETDDKKVKESKKGKQFVGNTTEAKSARKTASRDSVDSRKEDSKANEEGKQHQTRMQTRRSGRLQDKANGEKDAASENTSKKRSAPQSESSYKKKKNGPSQADDEKEEE